MKRRALGTSGIEASVVGLGTWAIGGWMWGGSQEASSIRAIHTALDEGINLIDTAAVYGFGLSEEIVGRAIAGRRDEVVLATKCGLVWDGERGEFHFASEGKKIYKCLQADSIRREVDASLRRLGTDRIDLLQTHWQEDSTPVEETMAALQDLKQQGKIRAIGVSNASPERIEAYRAGGAVDSDQEKYSMLDRGTEADLLPYCAEHEIAFLAYSPLALGLLTGKIGPERTFPETDLRHGKPRFQTENLARVHVFLDAIYPIAEAHDASVGQLVIAWTAAQPGVSHVLVGARHTTHALENARAGALELSAEEVELIDRAIEEHLKDVP